MINQGMATQPKPAHSSAIERFIWIAPERRVRTEWIAVMCFAAIALSAQIASGAYQAELAGYSDESSHAVTGIAVEQYLLHCFSVRAIPFFTNYYVHYPRIGLGHWPPLFYSAEAIAMLVGSPSKYSLLGLQALLATLLAWLVFRELKPLVGTLAAGLGAAALLLNRQIQLHTSMAMSEILLALTTFLACFAWARFAERRRQRDAIWFGLWTSAAVLTKGSGWAVLMIPAAVVLATGDWKLPFEKALRFAALIVAVLCLPWQIWTLKVSSEGWGSKHGLDFVLWAMPQFSKLLVTVPGVLISMAAVIGVAGTLMGSWGAGRTRSYWAALAGLVVATWLFHSLVPVGVEERKLIMAIPPLFVLAGAGAGQLSRWLFASRWRVPAAAIFSCIAVVTVALSLPIKSRPMFGLVPAARELDRMMQPQSAALIVGDVMDEGAIISEMAFRRPSPSTYLLRGTKLLASMNWNARDYHSRVHSEEECASVLASVPVSFIVLDLQASQRMEFFDYVEEMLRRDAAEWILAGEVRMPGNSRPHIAIFRRSGPVQPVHNLPGWIYPNTPLSAY
jgi:Dolichyl-phosphate-mannose-protein mannosyltransferase